MESPITRRVPKQQRSRERYEKILETAKTLIATHGNDAVSMREIAEASGTAISSVYQYFPDKNAVLWTLLGTHFERLETEWEAKAAAAETRAQLNAASLWLFEGFVQVCKSDPSFARLWASAQANVVLRELDSAHNRRTATTYTEKLQMLADGIDADRTWRGAYLMAHLASTALQVAFSSEDDCDAYLDDFRGMMRLWADRPA